MRRTERLEQALRTKFVILACLVATACSTISPAPRPLVSGFLNSSGVADPYEDGKQHLAAGRHKLAIERFGQVLAIDRRSLDTLNGLGVAYTGLGRFGIAQSYFERALQIDATNALTLNNYGWSLAAQGRLRDAKPFLDLAIYYAEEADASVIASNIESVDRARPSALLGALHNSRHAHRGHRIVRVGANAYRLETGAQPPGSPRPEIVSYDTSSPEIAFQQHSLLASQAQSAARADMGFDPRILVERGDAASSAQASSQHVPSTGTGVSVNTQSDAAVMEPNAGPALEAEMVPIQSGEKT